MVTMVKSVSSDCAIGCPAPADGIRSLSKTIKSSGSHHMENPVSRAWSVICSVISTAVIDSTAQKVRAFEDDVEVEVSFKGKEGVIKMSTLRVRTAKEEASGWKYQLKSDDGTTFADSAWFPEEELEIPD